MNAVVRVQGQQFRVETDQVVRVPRMQVEVGDTLALKEILSVSDGDTMHVGQPTVEGASVDAVVVGHGRGHKIRVYKFKRRRDYRRRAGHRAAFTELKIRSVSAGG